MEKIFLNYKYKVQTFGCQMNIHESEKIAGVLSSFGAIETNENEDADIVVVNSCAIRESAEKKIESFIGNLKALKKSGSLKCLVVVGCMTQQNNRAEELHDKFPFIDIILGTNNLSSLPRCFENWHEGYKKQIEIIDKRTIDDIKSIYRTSGVNAWVNISFGCNNFCTYCIVPYVRGREISRPMGEIIEEVESLLKQGYKQITLLGQNVNSYGNDIDDENITFANLLKELDKLDYKYRLRFMTSHPKDINDDVINVIANGTHICHSIHLPVQSGSTEVLARMNRKYTREHYQERIEKIKKLIPDVGLTTDIIVGFPGETEQDFNDTMSLIKEVGYQQIFGFLYSRRKGTVADKMENQVPLVIKKERLAKLIELEREIASQISEASVGSVVEVLIEGVNKGKLVGSTDQNKNVNIKMCGSTNSADYIGNFYKVKITDSKLTVLNGEIIEKC